MCETLKANLTLYTRLLKWKSQSTYLTIFLAADWFWSTAVKIVVFCINNNKNNNNRYSSSSSSSNNNFNIYNNIIIIFMVKIDNNLRALITQKYYYKLKFKLTKNNTSQILTYDDLTSLVLFSDANEIFFWKICFWAK